MMRINDSSTSLLAQLRLRRTSESQLDNFRQLSSGLRINRASDDSAGLAISEQMRAELRSLMQAERNANDGISLLQTAEGSLNQVGGNLARMRELAVQASNGTLNDEQRAALQQEFDALRSEVDRIAETTEFNGQALLDGSADVALQVGTGTSSADSVNASIEQVDSSTLAAESGTPVDSTDISTQAGAQQALNAIDTAISEVSRERAQIGSIQNRLEVSISNLASARTNTASAESRIRDADIAMAVAQKTRDDILLQAGVSVLTQANQNPALALALLT